MRPETLQRRLYLSAVLLSLRACNKPLLVQSWPLEYSSCSGELLTAAALVPDRLWDFIEPLLPTSLPSQLRFGTLCTHSPVSEELNIASSTRTDFQSALDEKKFVTTS